MTMPAVNLEDRRTTTVRELDDVITAAKHCMGGKVCEKGCPYYSKKRGGYDGNWHKDLLRWVVFLRRYYREQRPTTGE